MTRTSRRNPPPMNTPSARSPSMGAQYPDPVVPVQEDDHNHWSTWSDTSSAPSCRFPTRQAIAEMGVALLPWQVEMVQRTLDAAESGERFVILQPRRWGR